MASQRITIYNAEQAARKMLKDAQGKEALRLARNLQLTSHKVYELWLGDRNVNLLESLPDGWVPTIANKSFVSGGQRRTLYFDLALVGSPRVSFDLSGKSTLPTHRRIPANLKHQDVHSKTIGEPMVEAFIAAYDENNEFCEKIAALYTKSVATITSFTMTGALFKSWPEIEPYYPQPSAKQPSQLPAAIPQLNEAIGLPVG